MSEDPQRSDIPGVRKQFSDLRAEIRQDVIEAWEEAHPEGDAPESVRQVIRMWLSAQRRGIKNLPRQRSEQLALLSRIQSAKVSRLKALSEEESEIVTEAIRAAHWSDNSRASWSSILDDFSEDHPVLVFPIAFAVFLLLPMVLFEGSLNRFQEFEKVGGPSILFAGLLLVLALLVHGRMIFVIRSFAPKWVQVWRLFVLSVGFTLTALDEWRDFIKSYVISYQESLSILPESVFTYFGFSADFALNWFITFVFIAFNFSAGSSLLRRVGPKEPAHAVATAKVLLELLELATYAQAAIEGPEEGVDRDTEGIRPYVSSDERKEVIESLERVARLAEGRWQRSLRVGDPVADSAVASLGAGVAASARKWKEVAAVGGDRLVEMNEAFTGALVHAAQGNWILLAAEASGKELLRRRILRVVRHVLALSVMVATTYFVVVDPFALWGKGAAASPAVSSLILTIAAILSVMIDPTIIDRLSNASKVSTHFSAKK
ncbi:hypothetical protein [Streptomyces sp. NPDC058308]|uniref:hypothetical protein n=1 Tax=Streptomyces sp. NPDC058308 TaxID=3346440 RepID=UPI0036EA84B5